MLELERVAAAHWRGTEQEWLGEWLLRAADGFTGRANSALPLGDPGRRWMRRSTTYPAGTALAGCPR